jgi:2-(1,2-epoxy-1,2-dihydrophenyl)acetyl-CoA isomerase
MSEQHILLDERDHVATLTLNRPERMNAFGGRMRQELVELLEALKANAEIRVVVITGAGKAFCTGGDLREFADGTVQALPEQATSERPPMCKAVLAIHEMEKPVVASVNGVAAGGGCNLALACDIRIASETARFAQVFTRRGLHPDWGGIYFLPRLVGYAKAAELIMSGATVDAEEALRIGLVNRVVAAEDLRSATEEMAGHIARNAPLPIAFAKRGLQRFGHWDLAQALDYEVQVLEVLRKSRDVSEGIAAFLEKRDPRFEGR